MNRKAPNGIVAKIANVIAATNPATKSPINKSMTTIAIFLVHSNIQSVAINGISATKHLFNIKVI